MQGNTDRNESLGPNAPSGTGLAPNVAAALSYVLGLITGIIFLALDKHDPFVRFHAYQSIFVSVAIILVWIALAIISGILAFIPIIGWILATLLSLVVWLGSVVLWILLIIKAFQNNTWKLPYIGEMAERYASKR